MVFKFGIDIANSHANVVILVQLFRLFIISIVWNDLDRKIYFLLPKVKLSINRRKRTLFKILQGDFQVLQILNALPFLFGLNKLFETVHQKFGMNSLIFDLMFELVNLCM